MKNLVVCCDGTANQIVSDKTNVLKLFSVLEQSERQTAFYHPGLGTMEPDGALTDIGRMLRRLLGKAIGWGLERDVAHAYSYIMEHYQPGDRLYLFGFSRGAYTARMVASLLSMYGLFAPGNAQLVPYAIRHLSSFHNSNAKKIGQQFELAAYFKSTFASRPCAIHFLGVWDTVSSVGWIANPLAFPRSAYNPDVSHARHAIAIDERRSFYRQNTFRAPHENEVATDIEEVWFPGVHCDVGGGYTEQESGLAKISLEWMVVEAMRKGLHVDVDKLERLLSSGLNSEPMSPNAKMHKSLEKFWWIAELVPKKSRRGYWRINLSRRRTIPDGAKIHEAAIQRDGYHPALPADHAISRRISIREAMNGTAAATEAE